MDKGDKRKFGKKFRDDSESDEELQSQNELFDIASDKDFQEIFSKIKEQDKAFNEKAEEDETV